MYGGNVHIHHIFLLCILRVFQVNNFTIFRCRVWVHCNTLLCPNMLTSSGILVVWMKINAKSFYQNNVWTETLRMRYLTTYFNVWRFSKDDLHAPPSHESTILGHHKELKIIFSTYYYVPNIGVEVGFSLLSNSIQSLFISYGSSALHNCIKL